MEKTRGERCVQWRYLRSEPQDRDGWSIWQTCPMGLLRYRGSGSVSTVLREGGYEATFRTYPRMTQRLYPTIFEAQLAVERFFIEQESLREALLDEPGQRDGERD